MIYPGALINRPPCQLASPPLLRHSLPYPYLHSGILVFNNSKFSPIYLYLTNSPHLATSPPQTLPPIPRPCHQPTHSGTVVFNNSKWLWRISFSPIYHRKPLLRHSLPYLPCHTPTKPEWFSKPVSPPPQTYHAEQASPRTLLPLPRFLPCYKHTYFPILNKQANTCNKQRRPTNKHTQQIQVTSLIFLKQMFLKFFR